MLKDIIASFLNGAARWIGATLGVVFVLVIVASMADQAALANIMTHPTTGFEAPKWQGQDSILLIPVKETIGSGNLTRHKMRHLLQTTQSGLLKGKVKAILLDIDSTGGRVDDSEAIYHMIREYSDLYHVPVYALADGACASGAYLMACTAKKIYSSAYSTVGSVGVVFQWVNFSEALDKIGVKVLSASVGDKKKILSPFQPPVPEDEESLKPIMESVYERFITAVSSARPLLTEKVLRNQVGARFFSADEAKVHGYIDEIVNDRAPVIAALAQEAGLSSNYALIELQSASGLGDLFEMQAKVNSILSHIQTALAPTL